MPRFSLFVALILSGCTVMHTVTGDSMFKPEPAPAFRSPVVPEPEPEDAQYQAELERAREEAELPALPPKPQKKKDTRLALKRQ